MLELQRLARWIMDRHEGRRILERVQNSVHGHYDSLARALEDLEGLDEADVANYVETQAFHAKDCYSSQLSIWRMGLQSQVGPHVAERALSCSTQCL